MYSVTHTKKRRAIKSFATSFSRIRPQIESHVRRLQRGVRIGEKNFSPEEVIAAWWQSGEGWRYGSDPRSWTRILRILVSPQRGNVMAAAEATKAPNFQILLPISKTALASTAYEWTARFLQRMVVRAGRVNQSTAASSTETALNSTQEALYHILYEDRTRSPHARQIAKRLYNVYGFGYLASQGHREMLWVRQNGEPSEAEKTEYPQHPPENAPLEHLVEGGWQHFRQGALTAAMAWAEQALDIDPEGARPRRIHWLMGMIYYYSANFHDAARMLPEPGEKPCPDTGWWVKDVLTLTYACARAGELGRAESLIEKLVRENLAWAHLSVAIPITKAWICLGKADQQQAEELLRIAIENIEVLRSAQKNRNDQELGDPPYLDRGAVKFAIIQTAALMTTLGRVEEAMEILSPIRGLFAPIRKMLDLDPVFEPLRESETARQKFSKWLKLLDAE